MKRPEPMLNPVRLCSVPNGATEDSSGRAVGDDWCLAFIGNDTAQTEHYLTTDRVHASELLLSMEPEALGPLIVRLLNEERERRAKAWAEYRAATLDAPPRAPRAADAWRHYRCVSCKVGFSVHEAEGRARRCPDCGCATLTGPLPFDNVRPPAPPPAPPPTTATATATAKEPSDG